MVSSLAGVKYVGAAEVARATSRIGKSSSGLAWAFSLLKKTGVASRCRSRHQHVGEGFLEADVSEVLLECRSMPAGIVLRAADGAQVEPLQERGGEDLFDPRAVRA